MNSAKIAAGIFIITFGVAGSYFIVRNSFSAGGAPENQLSEISDFISFSFGSSSSIQWLENAKPAGSENSGIALSAVGDKNNGGIDYGNEQSVNLTEFVAKSMFNQMKALDQSGVNPFKSLDPKNPEVQKMIAEALSQIQNPEIILGGVELSDKDIKISFDNSREAKLKYLGATGGVIFENSGGFYANPVNALDKLIRGDASGVIEISKSYKNIFDGFLAIETPSDFTELHRKYLVVAKKFENLYSGLSGLQKDPVKADLLVRMIPQMMESETALKKEYFGKEKELGIVNL